MNEPGESGEASFNLVQMQSELYRKKRVVLKKKKRLFIGCINVFAHQYLLMQKCIRSDVYIFRCNPGKLYIRAVTLAFMYLH